jgi:MoaA/NifB/PqqE/SkfB family radical SAM enzyme
MSSPVKSLVVWLTFRCNYGCVYCSARKLAHSIEAAHKEEASAEKWNAALNNLPAATIDLTGGEPFLHVGIYDIINQLDDKHQLGVTTNLSLVDLDRLPEKKKISWTLSFHPSQSVNLEDFTEKALLLKQKYAAVTINYVACATQIERVAAYSEHFTRQNLRFHVDPDMFYYYNAEEKKLLSNYVQKDRIIDENSARPYPCRAGINHVHVMPDGTVFKCYYYTESLGNLFTKYQLYARAQFCRLNCRSGCDLDKVGARAEAMSYVTEQYKLILGREPEPAGLENYTELILKRMIKPRALPKILMSSNEYLEKQGRKKVLVAFLVRDCEKWLDRFLACLDRLAYPEDTLQFAIIEGNSKDESWRLVETFASKHERVWLKKVDVQTDEPDSVPKRSARLGFLRNKIIDEALTDEAYVLWLDSDIVDFPRSLLTDLIKAQVDIVAPYVLIENSGLFYDTLAFRKDGFRFNPSITNGLASVQKPEGAACLPNELYEVDSVGTCMLVNADVYRKGVRFGQNHPESEQVEFCLSARVRGFRVYVDPCVKVLHAELPKYGVAFH